MSKKKNRPPTAQSLIDSLLDEKSALKSMPESQPPSSTVVRPDDQTSSIVINLQEKIEERSGIRSRVTNALDKSASAIDLGEVPTGSKNDLALESQSGARTQQQEKKKAKAYAPPANAPTDDRTIQLEELKRANFDVAAEPSELTAEHKIPEPKNETRNETRNEAGDDRTQAVYAASRTVSPKTNQSETHRPVPVLSNTDAEDEALATIDRMMPTEIRTRGGAGHDKDTKQKVASSNYAQGGGAFASAEASLKQSESLRVAQKRITELEQELERLRRENENLSTAGDTLRRRTDELLSKSEQLEAQSRESEKIHDEEKKVFRGQLHQKDRDSMELRGRLEEMEGRLENNFKKIRVRERELEHRLEIIKMESATLIAGKDKMILDLKRQIDQLAHENTYGKQKSAELFNQFKGKQETIRRVVRALRIALTILEGDEDASQSSNKKND